MRRPPSPNVVAALRALVRADDAGRQGLLSYEIGGAIISDPAYTGRGVGQRGSRYASRGAIGNAAATSLRRRGWAASAVVYLGGETLLGLRVTPEGREALEVLDSPV